MTNNNLEDNLDVKNENIDEKVVTVITYKKMMWLWYFVDESKKN